ncbi:MAG: glycosyltransferase family 2 protein [Clostridium sp.]|nr:glycosyltransferase family 2 protein [Clostridium sp.]
MEKVSIIVPVYNMGNKIEICVKSLLNQTYENIEIILIDDGSKDDSLEHCKSLAESDKRVKAFHTANRGAGPARNYGIKQASGKYIYFPDADDFIEKQAIEILVSEMKNGYNDLVVFGYKNVNQKGVEVSTKKYPELEQEAVEIRLNYSEYMTTVSRLGIQGAPWNKFFSLDVIKKYNISYPDLRRHQDEGFIARYMNHAKKVRFISDIFYTYYTNDLKKEWDKYPVDYIEAVKGLHCERKMNVLTWNPEDTITHDLVQKEYICGIIKALELSFSPKFDFDKKKRVAWIKKTVDDTGISELDIPICLGKYQKTVLNIIKKKSYRLLYLLLHIKVLVEKNGIICVVRK